MVPIWIGLIGFSALSFYLTRYLIRHDEEVKLSKSQENFLGLVALMVTLLGGLIPIVLWTNSLFATPWQQFILAISFTTMLGITATVDAATKYIYDMLLLAFTVLHTVLLILSKAPWQDALLGALIGGGIYLAIRVISQFIFKREAFGMGDVYLMSAIGLVIGTKTVLMVAFGAFYLALFYVMIVWIIRRGRGIPEYVPFGPFMCLAAWLAFIWGDRLLMLYYRVILGL